MVRFTVEQMRRIMDKAQNIRNMTVIAHVDHGKSTLSDALICKAGMISEKAAGQARALDQRQDEIERGITIKSTGVSLHYTYTLHDHPDEYLINLIDSPGHVDFSSEVTAALRVTDGALVVVDTAEGVCVQTETVLRQAMQERIVPLLMVNKLDRAIGELALTPQAIYQQIKRVVESVNVVIATYDPDERLECTPTKGNVIFGAGKDQWAFSLRTFAKRYSKKFNVKEETLMEKLWGDHYFDDESGKWITEAVSEKGKPLKRAFVKYIMEPICRICEVIKSNDRETLVHLLKKIDVELTPEQLKTDLEKDLKKIVLSKWLPAADCLLESMILHLPSPSVAQRYRTPYLYEGPLEDETAQAMMNCDPHGPLCVYISKMIPLDGGRFAAFGRVFAGTVRAGERVRIMGPAYKAESKVDLFEKNVGQVGVFMMGKAPEFLPDVPCGNTVALLGIDQYLQKTGTIANHPSTYPIRSMKYSVSAVFKVAVRPKHPQDIAALQKALTKLSKTDPLLKCEIEETGEITLAGSGQLHMEICLNDLRKFAQCQILVSSPTVPYKETILQENTEQLCTKSTNNLNRLFGTSALLSAPLIQCLQKGQMSERDDPKARAKRLVEQFEWDKNEAVKIWSIQNENILVDTLKGAQYSNEIKESVCQAFREASRYGVLAGQPLRGCSFKLSDTKVHPDPPHRNEAQITPAARRLFQGLQLSSRPTLLQPIFMCEVTAPFKVLGNVYNTLSRRRATIVGEHKIEDSPLHVIKAYLPVAESFGLTSVLRANTQGMAFPQCYFDHWTQIQGVPLEDAKATDIVTAIRLRKGMKVEIPVLKDYVDQL